MCDYSLQSLATRPAVVGDKLITHSWGTGTTGFAPQNGEDERVAVCLLPGTELVFEGPVTSTVFGVDETVRTGRFRQINKGVPCQHHDAIEMSDGMVILLTHLFSGQRATVLQLPAVPKNEVEVEEQRRVEFIG